MKHPLRYLVSVLLAFAVVGTPAWALDRVRITVKPVAEVRQQEVRLGDVADVSGGSPEFNEALEDVVVGKSPPLGKNRILSANVLASYIRRQKIDPEGLEIEGPRYVRVYREAQEVSEPEIRALLMRYLETHLPRRRGRVELRGFSLRGNLTISKGRTTYEIIPPRDLRLVGNTNFQVNVRVDGKEATKLWALLDVDIVAPAVTAVRFLQRGHVVKSHDLAIAEASLGGAPDATFQEVSQVVGKRLVRSVNQGELVLRNHMEAPQMIRKGAVVTLVAERGLLMVTARGVALEGGEMGKVIRVKNLSSKKTVFARVIGSSTVRVDL